MASAINTSSSTLAIGTLLLLAVLLSLTFRLIATTMLSARIRQRTQQRLLVFHALALELVQLILVACGAYEICIIIPNPNGTYGSMTIATARLLAHAIKYTAAVYAINIIENLVVLGILRHPVQTQTLVLTRKVLLPALVRFCSKQWAAANFPMPKDGGLAIVARRGYGLQRVEKVFLVQRAKPRRKSTSYTQGSNGEAYKWVMTQESGKTATTNPELRRHSFPDDQLNTRPLLSDNRIERSISPGGDPGSDTPTPRPRSGRLSIPQDKGAAVETPGHKPRGRTPPAVRQSSDDSRAGNSGTVMIRVGEIEGEGSRSCERAVKRQDHGASRWRPAGGRVKRCFMG